MHNCKCAYLGLLVQRLPPDLGEGVGGVEALADETGLGEDLLWLSLAVNSVISAIKYFVRLDGFVEIQMSLGNVLLHNGPAQ